MNNKIIILIVIVILLGGWFYNHNFFKKDTVPVETLKQLKIISTKPSPLDEATILPTQPIEIEFNLPVVKSEFKHKFDPEGLEHEVEVLDGINSSYGTKFRIIFKKPLELGTGITLFILPNTQTEEGIKLETEVIYHITTIGYRGV